MENTATKTVNVDLPEGLYLELKDYANDKGVKLEDALLGLMTTSMRTDKLNNGIVSDFTPELSDRLENMISSTLKNTPFRVTLDEPVTQPSTETTLDDNTMLFVADVDLKHVIARMNAHRVTKGLAPIENSLCELLLHWGVNLGDNSIFNAVNGEDLSSFKDYMVDMAYAERERNNVPSDVIKAKGAIFSSFTIVDTPKNS